MIKQGDNNMKKIFALAMLIFATLACSLPNEVVTGTNEPTVFAPTSTENVNPTENSTSTTEPTENATVALTPVPTELYPGGELVKNGGMEEFDLKYREMTLNPEDFAFEHKVPVNWDIWYSGKNYLQTETLADYRCFNHNDPAWVGNDDCAQVSGKGNDYDLNFGRPEYKITDIVKPSSEFCNASPDNAACLYYRVKSGAYSAQWFSFARPTYSGYQQKFYLPAREFVSTCVLKIDFEAWVSDGSTGLASLPNQPNATSDDKLAVKFLLLIADGPYLWPNTHVLGGSSWAQDDIAYDQYRTYTTTVQIPAHTDEIYFVTGVRTAWPLNTQNFYVDNASLVCSGINYAIVP